MKPSTTRRLVIAACLAITWSSMSFGKTFGSLGLFLDYNSRSQDSLTTSDMGTYANLNIGIALGDNLFVAGKYLYHRDASSSTGGSTLTTTFAALGAGIGYAASVWDGFWTQASLLLLPTLTTAGSGSMTLYGGYGWALEGGYFFRAGDWACGPQLSLLSTTFTKENTAAGSASLAAKRTDMLVQQYFTVARVF